MQLTFEQMMASGMHLGHQTRKWHPKMAAYTYGVRKGLHLLDLVKTRQQLLEARSFLAQQAGEGKTRLFVGTKPQAARSVSEAARRARCFFVNERWLGGMLTNWRTVRSSLVRLHELERQERRGDWMRLPKKEAAQLRQLKERLTRYVGGLKGMRRLPDVVIVIGQQQELAAIAEARRLGIPVISLLDTDCDPELVQIGIPRNDDSAESIQLILEELVSAWREGLRVWNQRPTPTQRSAGRKPAAKRNQFRLAFFGCYKTKTFMAPHETHAFGVHLWFGSALALAGLSD